MRKKRKMGKDMERSPRRSKRYIGRSGIKKRREGKKGEERSKIEHEA